MWLFPVAIEKNVIPVVIVSAAVPLTPPLVAVIVTWPSESPITSPVEFTVATVVLLLDHVTGPVAFVLCGQLYLLPHHHARHRRRNCHSDGRCA